MKAPIFIHVENSYLDMHETLDEAEYWMEAIDVEDNLYRGFDAEGRLLTIEPYQGRAKITEAEIEPTHQPELIGLLKNLVQKIRPNIILKDDLPYLVSIVLDYRKSKLTRFSTFPFKQSINQTVEVDYLFVY